MVELSQVRTRLTQCKNVGLNLDEAIDYFALEDLGTSPDEWLSAKEMGVEEYRALMKGPEVGPSGVVDIGV